MSEHAYRRNARVAVQGDDLGPLQDRMLRGRPRECPAAYWIGNERVASSPDKVREPAQYVRDIFPQPWISGEPSGISDHTVSPGTVPSGPRSQSSQPNAGPGQSWRSSMRRPVQVAQVESRRKFATTVFEEPQIGAMPNTLKIARRFE